MLIVGAGMAGASLGVALAERGCRVVILEQEDVPGYHATGRSVAFWTETYGGPGVQPLTTASGPLMAACGVLAPRGALHIGRAGAAAARDAMLADFRTSGTALAPLDRAALEARLPGLKPDWVIGVDEPSCHDIDVAALHALYLGRLRKAGGTVMTGAELLGAERLAGGWQATTTAGPVGAALIVNAAGAWADLVATRCGVAPAGIMPKRRTVAQVRVDAAREDLPLVIDLAGRFYFKPAGAGRLWLSPHDEGASAPCDAAPEEIDIATAIDRFEGVVDWPVRAVERRWAGLRSFAPDRLPVYGFDDAVPGFFWFAGQGGFGIQTAPAAAALGAGLILRDPPGTIDPAPYAPARLRD